MAETFHVYFGPRAFETPIEVRRIGPSDCFAALKEGFADFLATPAGVGDGDGQDRRGRHGSESGGIRGRSAAMRPGSLSVVTRQTISSRTSS